MKKVQHGKSTTRKQLNIKKVQHEKITAQKSTTWKWFSMKKAQKCNIEKGQQK